MFTMAQHALDTCLHLLHVMQADLSGSAEEGGIKHAIQLTDAAVLNPVAYLNGLAKAITDLGGKIYEDTRVRKPDRRVIETDSGFKVAVFFPDLRLLSYQLHACMLCAR